MATSDKVTEAPIPLKNKIEDNIPFDFDDDRDGFLLFPEKPSHVLFIYKNFQAGLCTDTEVVFSNAIFKCHRWIIEAYMDFENFKKRPTSIEKFVTEYFCCLKAPELLMALRAYYRNSDSYDFVVEIGDEEFKCHYDVLRCYTNFFDHLRPFGAVKLPKSDVSIRAFFMIYRGWMLEQITELPIRGILEVYKAAKYLGVNFLIKVIEIALIKLDEEGRENKKQKISKYAPPKLINKMKIQSLSRK